jgi:endonuclease/exonuclease/phosphatase (EEP) superfamily protein YafD
MTFGERVFGIFLNLINIHLQVQLLDNYQGNKFFNGYIYLKFNRMELLIQIIKIILSAISIVAVVASILKMDEWWVRGFDFPRIQLLFLGFIAIVLFFIPALNLSYWNIGLLVLVLASAAYQTTKIFPYTYLGNKEVQRYKGSPDAKNKISILVSNVYTPNREAGKLTDAVKQYNPDLLLTLESDLWWEKQLEVLEVNYPHQVKVPLDNEYGMHLYSKLPLMNTEVLYIVKNDIPSIHSEISLPSGKKVKIFCLHPEPPSPSESDTSTPRDAELLIVGKNVKKETAPLLVFGDLNDVAWSRTTRLFQKISGLLDPRKGRGFFNTFHAKYFLLRWPLDHIFHSKAFMLNRIERLPSVGSDHFPIYINLQLVPMNAQESQEEELDQGEKEWKEETIDDADPNLLSI